jgi:hypothetical protein
MMLLPAWIRSSGAMMRRSRATRNTSLLAELNFRMQADRERVRADRNRLPLSILVIELSADRSSSRDVDFLAAVLEQRLRLTDIAGYLGDGRVAVLLPDTEKAGGWKVASDVCDLYPLGRERPNCEVFVYPDERQPPADEPSEQGKQPASGTFAPFDSLFAAFAPAVDRAIGACDTPSPVPYSA